MVPIHPLDPLTADEIREAVGIVRAERGLDPSAFFVRIALHEPAKDAVIGFRDGDPVERQAFMILRDRRARATCEAVVSITTKTVVSWTAIPGAQPPIVFDEFLACEALVRASPAWQAALRRRGVTDFDLAMVDPWSAGHYGPADDPQRR